MNNIPDLSVHCLVPAQRTDAICRAVMRFCLLRGWSPLPEVPLPNGRRADVLALRPDGGFAVVEVKSGARDFLSDNKWQEYREYCDEFFFAVDLDFPQELLPEDTGLLVAAEGEAALLRPAPAHALAPARRRALLLRYAMLGAQRLAMLSDPGLHGEVRSALRSE